jgi:hypothetical protein
MYTKSNISPYEKAIMAVSEIDPAVKRWIIPSKNKDEYYGSELYVKYPHFETDFGNEYLDGGNCRYPTLREAAIIVKAINLAHGVEIHTHTSKCIGCLDTMFRVGLITRDEWKVLQKDLDL